jgi:hypothetical protein
MLSCSSSETQKISRARGIAQVVEYLPSKCKALNSIPSTIKERQREKEKEREISNYTSLKSTPLSPTMLFDKYKRGLPYNYIINLQ